MEILSKPNNKYFLIIFKRKQRTSRLQYNPAQLRSACNVYRVSRLGEFFFLYKKEYFYKWLHKLAKLMITFHFITKFFFSYILILITGDYNLKYKRSHRFLNNYSCFLVIFRLFDKHHFNLRHSVVLCCAMLDSRVAFLTNKLDMALLYWSYLSGYVVV